MRKLTASLVSRVKCKFFKSLIILTGFCSISSGSAKAQVANVQDSLQLINLYDSTGGANWINRTGWLTTSPVRLWYGINLNSGGRVISINLTLNNLTGKIQDLNLNLPFLKTLFLSSNNISGGIPLFTGLPNIENLDLAVNSFSGSLPPLNLPQLKTLFLGRNPTSGTIPDFNLPLLVEISLYGNHLTGTIPNFNFPNLQYLNLNNNQLSGVVPNFNFPQLKRLDISENQLSGTVPNFNFPHVIEFNIWNNQLSGSIPNFNFLELRTALLHNNQLSGVIPNFNFPMLQSISLDHNQFSGAVPNFTIPATAFINLSYNKLLFDGLEYIEQYYANAVYSPQAGIIAHKRDSTLSVTAGGTLANDTCKWYRNNQLVATRIGDSTYTTSVPGFYSVKVTNSVATDLTLTSTNTLEMLPPIFKIDPNPSVITNSGTINTDLSGLDLADTVKGAATDGVTKVLLYCNSTSALKFWISGNNNGSLSSLSSQITPTTDPIIISPDGNGKVVAIYYAPDGFGNNTVNQTSRHIFIKVSSINGVDSTSIDFLLATPPVVMVHGMWSSPYAWEGGGFQDYLHNKGFLYPFKANYGNNSFRSFDPFSPESIPGRAATESSIVEGREYYRDIMKVAVAQVDIVAHSLGGLMCRSFSQQPDPVFKNKSNYFKGYIHKLITLGTPHKGSPLGPVLFDHKVLIAKLKLLGSGIPIGYIDIAGIMEYISQPIGTVHRDFEEYGDVIQNKLLETPPFYTHSITGNYYGGLIHPNNSGYHALDILLRIITGGQSHADIFSEFVSCINSDEPTSDIIVPLYSQIGGIIKQTPFMGTAHSSPPGYTSETNNEDIQEKVSQLLLSSNPNDFAIGFPKASTINSSCDRVANNRLSLINQNRITSGDQSVRIISPISGSTYQQNSGSTISLQFEATGGCAPRHSVFMIDRIAWYEVDTTINPFAISFTIPENASVGKRNIVLLVSDTSGMILADTLHINITPSGLLDSLIANPEKIDLDSAVRETSLYVKGYFNDGSLVRVNDLTNGSTGTIYTAQQGNIFSVSENGLVTAMAVGTDTLIVTNSGKTVKVPVKVVSNFQNAYHYPNTINFPSIPDKTIGDDPFGLSASATSGDDVVFTIVSGPAIIQNGILTMTGTGQITIKASQSGNVYFAPATDVFRTFCIRPVSPVITQSCNILSSNVVSGNQWYKEGTLITGATNQNLFITSTGMYNAKIAENGCQSILSNSVNVIPGSFAPTPGITAGSTTTFCQGGSVTLNSDAAGGNQWYRDGAAISGSTGTTLNVTTDGSYTAKVTVNGCESDVSSAIAVTVNPIPATPIITTGSATTFCTGESITVTSNAANGNQWYKDGIAINGSTGTSINVTTSGSYTTKVTLNNCVSATSNAIVVTVNSIPSTPAIIASTSTTFCSDGSVILTSNAVTGNQWYKDGVAISGSTGATQNVNASGSYTVKTTVNGCESATSNSILITVYPIPSAPVVTAGSATVFCTGGNVTLTSNAANGNQWYKNGIVVSGSTGTTLNVTSSGNYTTKVTVNGCESPVSNTIIVTVNLIPPAPVITANSGITICAGENVTLTSNASSGNQWYKDGVAIVGSTSTTLNVAASGNYTAKVTFIGCESAVSNAVVVIVKSLPPTPTISKNGNQLASNTVSGNQWYLDGNIITGVTGQIHIPTAPGNYTVQVTANGCKSAFSSAFNIASVPDIQVLPNPVRNKLSIIRSNTLAGLNIRLFDINGKEIKKINSSSSITEIDMSVYSAGTYIIWIEDRDKKILVKKVIVKL